MTPYRTATLLAVITIVGLIMMLVADGATDVFGILLAASPLVVGLLGWRASRRKRR
jgi:hypothetical protein